MRKNLVVFSFAADRVVVELPQLKVIVHQFLITMITMMMMMITMITMITMMMMTMRKGWLSELEVTISYNLILGIFYKVQ